MLGLVIDQAPHPLSFLWTLWKEKEEWEWEWKWEGEGERGGGKGDLDISKPLTLFSSLIRSFPLKLQHFGIYEMLSYRGSHKFQRIIVLEKLPCISKKRKGAFRKQRSTFFFSSTQVFHERRGRGEGDLVNDNAS